MGTVNVAFFSAGEGGLPVYGGQPILSENVTSSATSAQSSAATRRCVARICTDTAIRVLAGMNPTATATDVRIPADTVLDIKMEDGQKIAVIDE